jgi:hypothetical protein
MSNDYKSKSFKDWLTKLQQESWQLELIISGFAIFGLFTAFGPMKMAFDIAQHEQKAYQAIILAIGIAASSILILNLILHVVLRGLWIGALGLRYISGDIDYENLKYSEKFSGHLKKRVGSFDKYIGTLENYCSILFAVSFLLIFYVIAFFLVILTLFAVVTLILESDTLPENVSKIIGIPLIIFVLLGALLTFIDFITQGFLKKKKWISKIYFPIYWVFSYITLSFLYRPLVYNFLDNKFGRRLSMALLPFYFLIIVIISFSYEKSNYINENNIRSSNFLNNRNYETHLLKEDDFIRVASIQSKVITDPYLKLFRVYNESVENRIFHYHPSLKPKEDKRGLNSNITLFSDRSFTTREQDSLSNVYLKVFNKTHEVYIDSIQYPHDFIFSKNKNKQLGFETYINLKGLSEGKHILRLHRYRKEKKDTIKTTNIVIPFWYFKPNK